jgi:hypothetical protein
VLEVVENPAGRLIQPAPVLREAGPDERQEPVADEAGEERFEDLAMIEPRSSGVSVGMASGSSLMRTMRKRLTRQTIPLSTSKSLEGWSQPLSNFCEWVCAFCSE